MTRLYSMVLSGLLVGTVSLISAPSLAIAEANDGAQALIDAFEAANTPVNAQQTLRMVTTKKSGKVMERQALVKIRVSAGEVATLLELTEPTDVAGTQFLSIQKPDQEAINYLHLSKLQKTTQVKSKRAGLMGSDFSPAELDFSALKSATHQSLGDETITVGTAEIPCTVIESTLKDGAYARQKTYFAQSDQFPRQVDFMEADGTVVKRWMVHEVGQAQGRSYPKDSTMQNLKKGSQTQMQLSDVTFNLPGDALPAALFTPEGLGQKKAADDGAAAP